MNSWSTSTFSPDWKRGVWYVEFSLLSGFIWSKECNRVPLTLSIFVSELVIRYRFVVNGNKKKQAILWYNSSRSAIHISSRSNESPTIWFKSQECEQEKLGNRGEQVYQGRERKYWEKESVKEKRRGKKVDINYEGFFGLLEIVAKIKQTKGIFEYWIEKMQSANKQQKI